MPKRIAADTRRLSTSVAVTAVASFGASSPSVRNIVACVEAGPGRKSAVIAAGGHATLSQERHEKHKCYHGRCTKLRACHLSLSLSPPPMVLTERKMSPFIGRGKTTHVLSVILEELMENV